MISISIRCSDCTLFDDTALGVVLGGFAEWDGACSNIMGGADGRVLPGCNIRRSIRGGVVNGNASAEVFGDITWHYILRDGLVDY